MRSFELSEQFINFDEIYPESENFVQVAKKASYQEKLEIACLWLSEGIPYAFKQCPILYETIRGWLARNFDIHPKEITLIGSARIGYSLAPPPELGRSFNINSDLDFSIISEKLFVQCTEMFRQWSEDYTKKIVLPNNPTEKYFWDYNLEFVPKNINNGFIDPHKIPLRDRYPIVQKIARVRWLLQKKLKLTKNAPVAVKTSFRVFSDWKTFIRQIIINLNHTIKAINNGSGSLV